MGVRFTFVRNVLDSYPPEGIYLSPGPNTAGSKVSATRCQAGPNQESGDDFWGRSFFIPGGVSGAVKLNLPIRGI